jgi:halocyanin-like protein
MVAALLPPYMPLDRRTLLRRVALLPVAAAAGCLDTGPEGNGRSPTSNTGSGDGARAPYGPMDPEEMPHDYEEMPHHPDGMPHGGAGHHDGPRTGGDAGTPPAGVDSLASWFEGVENYDGVVDRRDESSVEIRVGADADGGAFAYDPPAVRVSPGTTVVWTWTGAGGAHDVVATTGAFESPLLDASGERFFATFDEGGVDPYYCTPHRALGMKGAVVVG